MCQSSAKAVEKQFGGEGDLSKIVMSQSKKITAIKKKNYE